MQIQKLVRGVIDTRRYHAVAICSEEVVEVIEEKEEVAEEEVAAIKIWCHFQSLQNVSMQFATTQPVLKLAYYEILPVCFHKALLCICVRWHMFNILNH